MNLLIDLVQDPPSGLLKGIALVTTLCLLKVLCPGIRLQPSDFVSEITANGVGAPGTGRTRGLR